MLNYDDELDQIEFDEAVRERHYAAGVLHLWQSEWNGKSCRKCSNADLNKCYESLGIERKGADNEPGNSNS